MLFDLLKKKSAMPEPGAALPGRPDPIPTAETHFVNGRPLKGPYPEGLEQAMFGMGCFWGVERMFWKLPGVWVTAAGLGRITSEIVDAPAFYHAEDYHQQYLAKNPGGYCGIGGTGVSCPIGVGV